MRPECRSPSVLSAACTAFCSLRSSSRFIVSSLPATGRSAEHYAASCILLSHSARLYSTGRWYARLPRPRRVTFWRYEDAKKAHAVDDRSQCGAHGASIRTGCRARPVDELLREQHRFWHGRESRRVGGSGQTLSDARREGWRGHTHVA